VDGLASLLDQCGAAAARAGSELSKDDPSLQGAAARERSRWIAAQVAAIASTVRRLRDALSEGSTVCDLGYADREELHDHIADMLAQVQGLMALQRSLSTERGR
jgi:hypothetical protein